MNVLILADTSFISLRFVGLEFEGYGYVKVFATKICEFVILIEEQSTKNTFNTLF